MLAGMDAALLLLPCPEPTCDAPAEVLDRMVIESTDGLIEHVRTQCLGGHRFFMPTPPTPPMAPLHPAASVRRRSDSGRYR
jgi:hypothetical protein